MFFGTCACYVAKHFGGNELHVFGLFCDGRADTFTENDNVSYAGYQWKSGYQGKSPQFCHSLSQMSLATRACYVN